MKLIYYIDSLHAKRDISSLYLLLFWWLWLTADENPKFKISENLNITWNQKDFRYRNVGPLKVIIMHMYSVLGLGLFCINYCLNAVWHGCYQPVALLRWATFSSSALFCFVSIIFLLTMPHGFTMGFRSREFAGHSSTVTPRSLKQVLVLLAVWAGAKSCWKMKSTSP